MARPRLDANRAHLSMRIKEHILQYEKVKATVLRVGVNILIEDALEKLLEKTLKMNRMQAYGMISRPTKMQRVPLTTMIKGDLLVKARELADRLDVLFAEVVEAALQDGIHADVDSMRVGRLKSMVIKEAIAEYLSVEKQANNRVISDTTKDIKNAEAKQQDNPQ